MSIFNFFKTKKTIETKGNLEEVISLASQGKIETSSFYKAMAENDLFVITPPGSTTKHPDGDHSLRVIRESSGMVLVFSSIERINENGSYPGGPVEYVGMKGSELFFLFPRNTSFILNGFSDISKELVPREIELILNS
jgi:hypothetical protein